MACKIPLRAKPWLGDSFGGEAAAASVYRDSRRRTWAVAREGSVPLSNWNSDMKLMASVYLQGTVALHPSSVSESCLNCSSYSDAWGRPVLKGRGSCQGLRGLSCLWGLSGPLWILNECGAGRGSSEVVGSEPEGIPSQFRERWCGVDEASEDAVETVEHQRTQSEEAGQLDTSPVRPPTVCSQSLRSYTGSTWGHSSWTGSNRAYSSWTGSRMTHSLRRSSRACSSWTGSSRVCSSWTGSRMTHSLRRSSRACSSWTGSSHKNHIPPWSPHRSHSWSRNRLAHSSTWACSSRRAHSSRSHSPHSRSHSPHSRSHSLRSSHSSPWFWWIEGGAGRGAGEREVQVWSSLSPGPLYPWVASL
ncbi:uncharacterized protein LOC111520603 [Piliocolobus tephrosceles]|uniref:uncharacterized protein LOC111520603 n=1 Tax=Piliocolobus tephrosceles TaxID=591936 RepID=UPI000C2AE702|nr:uncharacterized protein LOC111520603 [Piliocolobus tephrosceles]